MKFKLTLILYSFALITNAQLKVSEYQYKDYFDFQNVKEIAFLGMFKIDTLTKSKIVFNKSEGDITDKVLYDNKKKEFNFNGTYKLTTVNNQSYYFKFGWQDFANKTELNNLNWLKGGMPNINEIKGQVGITVVEIPFKQFGKTDICTIGDSQTWWSQGRYLRKFMNELNNDFIFIGSNQDVFGYPHEGEGGNRTKDVVKRLSKIPLANTYTLLLGTNDYNGDVNVSSENLTYIVQRLKKKNPKALVLYITPLPTSNKLRDEFNNRLKEKFIIENKNSIKVIHLGEYIRNYDNWKQLFSDGLHPNKLGYRIIAAYLTLEINNWIYKEALKN